MVTTAKRNSKLIPDLTPQAAVLPEAKMVSVRRLSTPDQTRMCGDEVDVITVANSARLSAGAGLGPVMILKEQRVGFDLFDHGASRRELRGSVLSKSYPCPASEALGTKVTNVPCAPSLASAKFAVV